MRVGTVESSSATSTKVASFGTRRPSRSPTLRQWRFAPSASASAVPIEARDETPVPFARVRKVVGMKCARHR
jgi:hypothetical protein